MRPQIDCLRVFNVFAVVPTTPAGGSPTTPSAIVGRFVVHGTYAPFGHTKTLKIERTHC